MHFLLRKNCGAACGKGRRDALWTKKETPDFSRVLVEHSGFEPLTSTMRMSRATKTYVIYPRYSQFSDELDRDSDRVLRNHCVLKPFNITTEAIQCDEEM